MMKGWQTIVLLHFWLLLFHTTVIGQLRQEQEKKHIRSIKYEKNPVTQFNKTLDLGNYYLEKNLKRADSIQRILLQQSRNFDERIRFKALLFSAKVNEMQGNQEEYFKDVLAMQPYLNKLKSDEVAFEILLHLGNYHRSTLDYSAADFYLRKAKKIAISQRNNAKVARTQNSIALNFMVQNLKDSALYYTDLSIQFSRRTANKAALSESFNTQARIYDYFGQVELSVAKNIIALELATEINNYYILSKYHRELGQSQRSIQNLDDAAYYFQRSYEFAQQIFDKRQMGLSLIHLGTIHYERKEYRKAISNTIRAIHILTELNDINGLGEAHNNLGMVYREQKFYGLAASNFNQALVLYESTGNREKIAEVYHNVGTVFQQQKKYTNAINYLNRSIEIREQFGSKNQIYHSYRVIASVYKELGNKDESLKYMQLYLDYIDRNTTIQAATKIAELSELYRSEQRDRLITLQADSIERQRQERALTSTKLENSNLRNTFQWYIILGFALVIILAGIIGFYRWNQTKIKQERKEAEMSQTLLRAQMNPHFVFNAMSVIQSYIYENDTVNSSKFLVNFSRLMRLILENSPKEFIPIETEVEILQKYLETQKLRFEDRFSYSIILSDEIDKERAVIPPMITQPFIENAIEHGQLHTVDGGFIRITFTKKRKMFHIKIEDNGIGRKSAELNKKSKLHKSMAMKITKERIDNFNKKYKTDGFLKVEDFDTVLQTGTKVVISLPYKEDEF